MRATLKTQPLHNCDLQGALVFFTCLPLEITHSRVLFFDDELGNFFFRFGYFNVCPYFPIVRLIVIGTECWVILQPSFMIESKSNECLITVEHFRMDFVNEHTGDVSRCVRHSLPPGNIELFVAFQFQLEDFRRVDGFESDPFNLGWYQPAPPRRHTTYELNETDQTLAQNKVNKEHTEIILNSQQR
ncbi:hypothetical protein K435DRAFT_478649 [Dendrothele bispora CBS 962.96]|uniref:Uncharacterized protein n=1 Tax=Dendrothele bispora (strain CBS 962.96) TaxID=1314807 RepID=A0A4S8MU22_DENBC|nr:hypothetical protein K435DRAFT_478649 [Dendrothele bispora CBS 962.96]